MSSPPGQRTADDLPELLRARAAGVDVDAELAAVIARVQPQMWRFARTMTATDDAVDEIVQESWAVAMSSVDGFEARSSVLTWLLGIVRNVARRSGERERLRRTREADLLAGTEDAVDPLDDLSARLHHSGPEAGHWSHPPRARFLPEDHLVSSEFRAHLSSLIAQLPPRQQDVLVLRDVVGLTSSEVAELIDVAPAAQRTLLHRARHRLRAVLESEREERS